MKKKNTFMRLAMALVLLVLVTTSAVGGTFAKYTTTKSSEDSARVAKWGFEPVDMNITDLFKNVYEIDTDYTVTGAADVIAPGTQGSAQFAFAYDETNGINAPEVDYTFKVSTAGSEIDEAIENNGNIQWKLDDGTFGTWDSFIAAIEALDGDEDYEAGELPAGFGTSDNTHTVYWRWIFTSGDVSDTTDTAMGNADELAEVKLVITITATQID